MSERYWTLEDQMELESKVVTLESTVKDLRRQLEERTVAVNTGGIEEHEWLVLTYCTNVECPAAKGVEQDSIIEAINWCIGHREIAQHSVRIVESRTILFNWVRLPPHPQPPQ